MLKQANADINTELLKRERERKISCTKWFPPCTSSLLVRFHYARCRYARVLQFLLWWCKMCGAGTPILIKFIVFVPCWEFTLLPSTLLETRMKREGSRDLRFISTSDHMRKKTFEGLPHLSLQSLWYQNMMAWSTVLFSVCRMSMIDFEKSKCAVVLAGTSRTPKYAGPA